MDKPGQLVGVSKIIADLGGNVTAVHHERADANANVNGCFLRIQLETRNFEHLEQIKKSLSESGYKIVE